MLHRGPREGEATKNPSCLEGSAAVSWAPTEDSLISQAPCARRTSWRNWHLPRADTAVAQGGCRASQGRFPPPLSIRVLLSCGPVAPHMVRIPGSPRQVTPGTGGSGAGGRTVTAPFLPPRLAREAVLLRAGRTLPAPVDCYELRDHCNARETARTANCPQIATPSQPKGWYQGSSVAFG